MWKCRAVESLENQMLVFHPSQPPLEIALRFPHSHTLGDDEYTHEIAQNSSPNPLPMSSVKSVTYVSEWTRRAALDDFIRLRSENPAALQALNLQPADLAQRGKHPALGVVALSELLAAWAVHDLTHEHQLSRVMARQHRAAVGPWSALSGACCGAMGIAFHSQLGARFNLR